MTVKLVLSVIVPFYNEDESIRGMHTAIVEAVEPLGIPFEMVFVNDGSQDRTLDIATAIAAEDERVTVINFRRNFGQTAAMAAGFEHAQGEVLVTLDGDLQNDPRDIEHLLRKIDEGYDVVVGWRSDRQDKLLSRRIPAKIANWLIDKATGVPIHDNGCTLKAYRGSVIKGIPLYVDMHRFIPAMAVMAGAKIAEIEVRHHARQFGASKYGLSRTYKVLLDLMVVKTVTRFAARPLLWFSMLAAPLALVGTIEIVHSLWRWAVVTGKLPLPVAGTGVLFLVTAFILFLSGILGALVYELGDTRESEFSRLTTRVWNAGSIASTREVADRA